MLSKKGEKKFIYSGPAIIIIVIVAFALLHGTINAYGKMKASKEKRVLAERELLELSGRQEILKSKVRYLGTDKGRHEALVTKYNIAKEGEEVFVIIDNKKNEEKTAEEASFWNTFWSRATVFFR